MRRTVLLVLALVAALVFAPAAHADSTTTKILRDCIDDGILEGNYTPSELRKARDNMPTDAQEYSDCGDVLDRALSSDVSSHDGGSPSTPVGGGSTTGGGSPPAQQFSDSAANGSRAQLPTTAPEKHALYEAAGHGGDGDVIAGRPLAPAADIGGHLGRNPLPGSLIVVLVLLGGALLAVVVPTIVRRVRARSAP
jgi:hypothetical protein